ncbi:5'-3' exoribonuclease 2-like [Cimex lectularius]|uniref:CPR type cuticle protein n=1 Tax=Cimex lectularius TaxID=79782 RepID=A0A8I6S3K8_CIMLE|nr:5'-3' exoribonuclease 2-like [Cimex lectularius]
MKPLVVVLLGFVAYAAAGSWGHHGPVDTPEVAAAKAAHFAAVAKASGHGGAWNGAGAWNGGYAGYNGGYHGGYNGAYNGGHDDGQWHDDTHLYDYAHGHGWNSGDDGQWRDDTHQWNNGGWNQWNGNRGEDGDDGQWHDDTHLYADHGQYNGGAWAGHGGAWAGHGGAWAGHGGAWAGYGAGYGNGYGGAWAGHGGHLVNGETPEVAAARAAHLAAHAAAAHRHRRSLVAVNPHSLPVPADTLHVALAKQAQLVQQHTEGTRNVLGGGVPLHLPADTPEVALGKQAHAVAHARQNALTHSHAYANGLHGVAAVAPVAAVSHVAAVAPVVSVASVAPVAAVHSVPAVVSTHTSVLHSAPLVAYGHHGHW